MAVRHLADLGHRRIAFVAGPLDTSTGWIRRQAFQQSIAMCQRATPVAVQALYKIVTDTSMKASVTVAAATAIMKFGRESIELDDLARTLRAWLQPVKDREASRTVLH